MRQTKVLTVDPHRPDPGTVEKAARILRSGGLVAFPTETVYGLGAHALDPNAVRAVFAVKGRPADNPLIVHVSDAAKGFALAKNLPAVAFALAEAFWPGPLTLVVPSSGAVPKETTAGLDTVALRVPAHPVALALLAAAGVPVAAPSANRSGRPSPTRAAACAGRSGRPDRRGRRRRWNGCGRRVYGDRPHRVAPAHPQAWRSEPGTDRGGHRPSGRKGRGAKL